MKNKLLYIAFGVVCGLLGSGILFLANQPPRGSAIQLSPPPTPHLWVVQVIGAVNQPGVYELPTGSRVRDAVQAAGGLSPDANSTFDLASLLWDGELVFVPWESSLVTPAERSNPLSIPLEPESTQDVSSQASSAGLININTAALEELDQLPDIGPVIAQRIINYRTLHGPFVSIEGVMDVQGIGDGVFDKIKNMITVTP
jgi:competence protein ComEA